MYKNREKFLYIDKVRLQEEQDRLTKLQIEEFLKKQNEEEQKQKEQQKLDSE